MCFLCVQTYKARSYLRTRVYSLGTATVYRAQRAGAGPSSRRSEAPPRSLSRGARTSRVERRCHASSAYRGRGLNFTKTLVITGQQAEGAAAGPLCNSMRAFGPGGRSFRPPVAQEGTKTIPRVQTNGSFLVPMQGARTDVNSYIHAAGLPIQRASASYLALFT